MNVLIALCFVTVWLTVQPSVDVNALQCYVCEGVECDNLNEDMLQYCGPEVTTPPSTTITENPPEDVTPSTEETTTEDLTTTTDETNAPIEQLQKVQLPRVMSDNVNTVAKSSAAMQLIRRYRSIQRFPRVNAYSYTCYTANVKRGDDWVSKRGCIRRETSDDPSACDLLPNQLEMDKNDVKDCVTCQREACNSSHSLKFSFITLLVTLMLKLMLN